MKIFGIPLKIDPSFFAMISVMAFSRISKPVLLIEWLGVVLFSVLIHELGHAFAGKAFGLTPTISFVSWGGLTSWEAGRNVLPWQSMLISFAGPGAGFLLGSLVLALKIFSPDLQNDGLWRVTIFDLIWVNFGWGLFNLLPILPLDGGNIAGSIEEWVSKKYEHYYAIRLSLFVACSISIWALMSGKIWIFFVVGWCAANNFTSLNEQREHKKNQKLYEKLEETRKACNNKQGTEVIAKSQEILQVAQTYEIRKQALNLLIRGYIIEKDFEKAKQTLENYQAKFGESIDLKCMVYFAAEEWQKIIDFLQPIFESAPQYRYGSWLMQAYLKIKNYSAAIEICGHKSLEKHALSLYSKVQAAAFYAEEFELSIEIGLLAFAREENETIAYDISCSYARMNRLTEAIIWLNKALDLGYSDFDYLLKDSDFDNLSHVPQFDQLIQRIKKNNDNA